jgi:hypothetical protein
MVDGEPEFLRGHRGVYGIRRGLDAGAVRCCRVDASAFVPRCTP